MSKKCITQTQFCSGDRRLRVIQFTLLWYSYIYNSKCCFHLMCKRRIPLQYITVHIKTTVHPVHVVLWCALAPQRSMSPTPLDVNQWCDGPDAVSDSLNSVQKWHYNDVIMGAIASQITIFTMVYSTVYSDTDQRKHQSSASQAFVSGIHRGPGNSSHKRPCFHLMMSSWITGIYMHYDSLL